jgi:hypothetical protein
LPKLTNFRVLAFAYSTRLGARPPRVSRVGKPDTQTELGSDQGIAYSIFGFRNLAPSQFFVLRCGKLINSRAKNDREPDIEGLGWNGGSGPGSLIRYETFLIAETHLFYLSRFVKL